jgi:hypothetical protein
MLALTGAVLLGVSTVGFQSLGFEERHFIKWAGIVLGILGLLGFLVELVRGWRNRDE